MAVTSDPGDLSRLEDPAVVFLSSVVGIVAGTVRRGQRGDGTAISRNPGLHALPVAQGVQIDRSPGSRV